VNLSRKQLQSIFGRRESFLLVLEQLRWMKKAARLLRRGRPGLVFTEAHHMARYLDRLMQVDLISHRKGNSSIEP